MASGVTVSIADIEAARQRIVGRVRRTPLLDLEPRAFGVAARLSLKLEQLQHTGSFKSRGAFNRMLALEVPPAGVIAASGGNFGIAVAYAARELGHRAEIHVPETSPATKIDRLRSLGADVHMVPGYYPDALAACEARAESSGALFMHAFDQPEVVAGAGTIAAELDEEAPGFSTVVVAVGGGGLIAGIAAWFAGRVRVIGVEPRACSALHAALEAGAPVDVEVGGVAADGLGAGRAGTIAFGIARRFVDRVVLVEDAAILDAQRRLWDGVRVVAEPGAATALAGLTAGAYVPRPDEHVVVVVCGANTDPASVH
jgi:threonine dehydratase